MKIYSKKKGLNFKETRLFGISLFKKQIQNNIQKIKYLMGIFKIKKTDNTKKYYLFGIPFYRKTNQIEKLKFEIKRLLDMQFKRNQKALATMILHQKTFAPFKNKHKNDTVVLLGAGPTLKYFSPIKNAIYVGVNRVFLYDKVKLDYLFTIDKLGVEEYYDKLIEYDCIKFIGNQDCGKNWQIPENIIAQMECLRYNTTSRMNISDCFTYNIDIEPLCNFRTVSLQAIQFILYTNPKRVYLVGNDCTCANRQHFQGKSYDISFRGENIVDNDLKNISAFRTLKDFLETYYPQTEIISVNPVGLKGLFKDVYTQDYISQNPEVLEQIGTDITYLDEIETKEAIL